MRFLATDQLLFFYYRSNVLLTIERDSELLARIVHIYDGRAIAFNRLLCRISIWINQIARAIRQRSKRGIIVLFIRFRNYCSLGTRSSGLCLREVVAISIVIGIFQPMYHRIGRVRIRRPMSCQGHRISELTAESKLAFAIVPTCKGIAGTGRFSGLCCSLAGQHKDRLDVATVIRVEGNPMPGFHLRPQGHVLRFQRHAAHLVGQAHISIPAGNAFFRTHGEGHIRSNHIALDAFLRGIHASFLVHEEHIVHLGKLGRQRHILGFADVSLHTKAGKGRVAIIPAQELVTVLFWGGRGIQGVACLHNLRADSFTLVQESIGNVASAPVLNGQKRSAWLHSTTGLDNFRYRGKRHAAEDHQGCHHHGEHPAQFSLHCSVLLTVDGTFRYCASSMMTITRQ